MTSKDDRPTQAAPSTSSGQAPSASSLRPNSVQAEQAPLTDSGQALRRRAEEMALRKAAQSPENLEALSPEATRKLLHELRVHQIELEMQNEDLRQAQAAYFDLYDLAPVGYVTVSEKGLILEANLTAATLLGVAKGALVKQAISRFIFREDQDLYCRHRKQLFETEEPQACELRMVKMDGTAFWAHLEATAAQAPSTNSGQASDGAPVCRVVLSDITERKRVEENLKESKALTEAVVENVPLMVFVKESTDLRFVIFNRAGEELLG
jgi:PAS domain S-box-containing protein